MTATLARFIGFLVVTAALLACGGSAGSQNTVPRYAEYSLDPGLYPASIDCFYGCLRSTREEFRDACFSQCDGVVASTTAVPCPDGSRPLCRSYELEAAPPSDEESDDDAALAIIGGLLELGGEIADDAADSKRTESRSRAEPKKRSKSKETSATAWGTKPSSKGAAPKSAFGSRVEKKRR